ncbi:hypothetical protein [Paenibacillus pini]|uniref:Uncharacterized protein n=1 Tax=Paenibacillus pini JCM 16418 TaxID=1236976 RepID=W7Y891_9BACL|nr:hypothetical protein [Paenibacillus pini]GAF07130.1 hypothetical protein JCM16418_1120 [Paenibacillus pini JCM 16418]
MLIEKEIQIAIERGQQIFVKNLDGYTITGTPEQSEDPLKLRMRTIEGAMWLYLNEIDHISRLISFR